jgi:hypothetical protein
MRTITDREKRTIRLAAMGIGAYLVLFGGVKVWKFLEKKRADYRTLVAEAQTLKLRIEPYKNRAEALKKLMDAFQIDPAALTRATAVGEASAAIQKAAASSGIQVGPVRESPARGANKELASVQFEGIGAIPALMGLLKQLESLGYPLLIDSVQITPEKSKPGQMKMNLTVVILDFEQWKREEKPHA